MSPDTPPEVAEQMRQLRAEGASYHAIAAALNRAGARGRLGGRWFAASVRRVMNNNELKETQCKA